MINIRLQGLAPDIEKKIVNGWPAINRCYLPNGDLVITCNNCTVDHTTGVVMMDFFNGTIQNRLILYAGEYRRAVKFS